MWGVFFIDTQLRYLLSSPRLEASSYLRKEEAWKPGGSSQTSQMGAERESPSILGNPNRRVRQEERHIVSAGVARQSQWAGSAWE
jgi:hypothetical protein